MKFWKTWFFPITYQKSWLYNANIEQISNSVWPFWKYVLSCIYCAQCAVWGTPFLVFHSLWHKPRSNVNRGVADLIPYINQIWCSFLALPVRAACNVMFHRKHCFKSHKWQIVFWPKYRTVSLHIELLQGTEKWSPLLPPATVFSPQ